MNSFYLHGSGCLCCGKKITENFFDNEEVEDKIQMSLYGLCFGCSETREQNDSKITELLNSYRNRKDLYKVQLKKNGVCNFGEKKPVVLVIYIKPGHEQVYMG